MTSATAISRRRGPGTIEQEITADRLGSATSPASRLRDDRCRRLADEYGAAQFITKPGDFDLLKAQLRQLPNVAV